MIGLLKRINRAARRAAFVPVGILRIAIALRQPIDRLTYYPEEERKSRARMFAENVSWLLRNNEINYYYFLYGLDRKRGPDASAFIPYRAFKEIRNRCNTRKQLGRYFADYTCILKDKFVFFNFLAALGFPTPRVLALGTREEILWLPSGKRTTFSELGAVEGLNAFCKTILGECAVGAFPFRIDGSEIEADGMETTIPELRRSVGDGFIIQERVEQHPRMAALHPHSMNTIRLVTVNDGRRIYPLVAGQRIGAHGNSRDNWAIGGLLGLIDLETGRFSRHFFFKPGSGGKVERHPDTGVVFEGFEVPHFREAVDAACRLHGFLYGIHSIGWDIGITGSGPVFIEGNDNWELTVLQAEEGLKERFLASLPKPGCGG